MIITFVGRLAQHVERERAGVVVELEVAPRLADVAVPLLDDRAEHAVVVEQQAGRRGRPTSTRKIGLHCEKTGVASRSLLVVVVADVGQHGSAPRRRRPGPRRARRRPGTSFDRSRGRDPARRPRRGRRPARTIVARRADGRDEEHDDGAGQAGAEQVGEVEPADALGLPAEQRRDHHADRDERREQRQADHDEPAEVAERVRGAVVPDARGWRSAMRATTSSRATTLTGAEQAAATS